MIKKLYAAFRDLGKAHDKVDVGALWNVPKFHGVGRQVFESIK